VARGSAETHSHSISAPYDYEEFEKSHGRQPGTLKALALAHEKRVKNAKPNKNRRNSHFGTDSSANMPEFS
jgi:hypothetical protein